MYRNAWIRRCVVEGVVQKEGGHIFYFEHSCIKSKLKENTAQPDVVPLLVKKISALVIFMLTTSQKEEESSSYVTKYDKVKGV